MTTDTVNVWEEDVIIPTYEIGKPERNPIFLDKRVYQGSSGEVYPHAVIESISDKKINKTYRACYLENRYVKIMILPELGGRVQMAYDKIKQRHFVYYNQVIKPALVGLTGPWISGGIEFNWPQHHRPSTFEATDYQLEENADGSKTVWCSEVERMFRTKGMAGFTLHPDKAYLEIKVKLFNRTALPQTFLWWANPAVKVNDHYQSIFPPDVNAVFDHGKRDVSTFPVARGTYYKIDYSAGVDISKYKNIPVPTSYMAIVSDYDFIGCYEHDTQAGMLHVANHHLVPGKKQWTWGNGDFGKAWDRNLTDEDGPYIELMCGAFTDNQPDFSWLMPFEEKSFSQFFMPFHSIGYVRNATKEAMVNLELENNIVSIKIYTTSIYNDAKLVLKIEGKIYFETSVNLNPEKAFLQEIKVSEQVTYEQLHISVLCHQNIVLVEWTPETSTTKPIPDAAKPIKAPSEIESIEELYLSGLHLEQYRHATFSPLDYYEEALRREPSDTRSNNAMGLWMLRRAKFEEAAQYFQKAISTATSKNPNPYDGASHYFLGAALKNQGESEEAKKMYYKSVWNAEWQDAGYLALAQLATAKKEYDEALNLVDQSLIKNWHNHKSRHLKVILLRKLGREKEATTFVNQSLEIDSFNLGCLYEQYLLSHSSDTLDLIHKVFRNNDHTLIEYSLDYAEAGLYEEAIHLLDNGKAVKENTNPMVNYLIGHFYFLLGKEAEALSSFQLAATQKPDYCFPNRPEEVMALQRAIKLNPEDSKANYYLGNFWYAKRLYDDAVTCWEKSVALNDTFPTALRNLSLAYYNKADQKPKAQSLLERSFTLDTTDARVLMELDQLYKKLGIDNEKRLELLEQHPSLVDSRDDLYLEHITLFNQLGKFDQALKLLSQRKFHPWEGGEGKVTGQFILCHLALAKEAIQQEKYNDALEFLKATETYPDNLGEGKLHGVQENDIHYFMACAYAGLGDEAMATTYFTKASQGLEEPSQVFFYNDQHPDKIFYQGLALAKLGNESESIKRFNKLITYGESHINDEVKVDYFAVSLPDLLIWSDDLQDRNQVNCLYLIGLGYLGLKNAALAKQYLTSAYEIDKNHMGVQEHLEMVEGVMVF